ncbi:lipoyl(octanoyl) transferase LipB [Allokutzneria sp. A3M-2-11 16]|uniref:lipoyl(octanoyl) transferase LipB n=1 Tax=Allokutzneria sp. A3M-2-11 16 TaxID=2962043 RepID=UPI0020B744CB|nr:lipoyl(octanoyl) transferase LipB [Allokutzneria sp. A3M-2-11 16]MCP3804814.1 lipoyl(octanoyl) transferase LipB [Allokutzneria sp. A3M-2-11 16]
MQGFRSLARVDLGELPYDVAVVEMAEWAEQCRAGAAGDRLFLLSHPPVVTYGPRTPREHLPADLPIVPVDRGGLATYHGPGQIVGYLVADVRERGPADVVRWLENGIIAALTGLGFPARRRDTPPGGTSLVGVWTPDDRKVAAIGMRIRGGVSTHGFALNVDPDMGVYERFTACGLAEPTTSLREWAWDLGRDVPTEQRVRDALAEALGALNSPQWTFGRSFANVAEPL